MDEAVDKVTERAGRVYEESSFAVLVALAGALFTSGLAYTLQCSAQYECLQQGTCRTFGDGTCSFSNVVSPAGYKLFNMSSSSDALASLTRGVCSAGERQTIDSKNRLVCVRAPSFPSAFNAEAADESASTDHERACGRWIRSKRQPLSTEYFSFYDEQTVASDVMMELQTEFNPSVVTDDVDRFRAACERMVANNAVAPAASNAYEYLKTEIGATIGSTDALLRATGKLVSHYCDAPILMGISFGTDGRFHATAIDGLALESEAASEALYAMGEWSTTREMVRAFVSEMETAPSSLTPPPTQAQLGQIVVGAVGGTWLDDAIAISGSSNVVINEALSAMGRFLYAAEETDFEHARAYLLAVASQCAFATRAATNGEFGTNAAVQRATEAFRQRGRHRAASLGRIHFEGGSVERFAPVNASFTLDATTITWSRLSNARSIATSTTSDAQSVCWDAATIAFPDELDTKVLRKLTTDRLLTSVLPPIVATLKDAVAVGIQNGRVAALVADPAERATLAANARAVKFKIAGAARDTEFGRDGEFTRPAFRSDDGALLMLLKQARSIFLDRIALALENSDLCEHPPLFPSLTRNAYLLTLAPCAMLLPGILVPPFASDRYDQSSMYGRIGFVIAHEVAHVASRTELWDEQERSRLLANYTRSTHVEAAADLTAADAVVATGKITSDQLCGDVSQMWCGRDPDPLWSQEATQAFSHPPVNARGDRVCEFLRA